MREKSSKFKIKKEDTFFPDQNLDRGMLTFDDMIKAVVHELFWDIIVNGVFLVEVIKQRNVNPC